MFFWCEEESDIVECLCSGCHRKPLKKVRHRTDACPRLPVDPLDEVAQYLASKFSGRSWRVLAPLPILLLTAVSSRAATQTEEQPPRFLSIHYGQQAYFSTAGAYTHRRFAPLPVLEGPARFHGMTMQGALSEHLIVGLKGYGSLKDSENTSGYTNWGGGLAAAGIEYREVFFSTLFVGGGVWLGCGRFDFSVSDRDKNESVASFSDAIFVEPQMNFGVVLFEHLLISVLGSFLLPLFGGEYRIGNSELPSAFPQGFFAGGSIGYQFPYLLKKK